MPRWLIRIGLVVLVIGIVLVSPLRDFLPVDFPGYLQNPGRTGHFRVVPAAEVSQVRLRNQTGMPIEDVKVNGVDYGDIPAGGVSRYREMASAYRDAKVELVMNGMRMRLHPDDDVGEQPLGPGHFTYVIVTQRGATMTLIDLQAVKDAD